MLGTIDGWDRRAMVAVARTRNPLSTAFLRAITWTAWGGAWAALVIAIVACLRMGWLPDDRPFLAGLLGASAGPGVSWIFVTLAKKKWRRKRPYEAVDGCERLTAAPTDDSFPSGHSAAAFAFLTLLLLRGHPAAPAAAVWAPLVAYSRVYLGVHYPSDIFVGSAFGAILGFAISEMPLPPLY